MFWVAAYHLLILSPGYKVPVQLDDNIGRSVNAPLVFFCRSKPYDDGGMFLLRVSHVVYPLLDISMYHANGYAYLNRCGILLELLGL